MRPHVITIKDIARDLNISVATVSRALRNTHDVNAGTREKVLSKAKQLNYTPNYHAIGLVKNNSFNIGVVLPAVINFYFSTAISGIQEIAFQHGFNVVLFVTSDSSEREAAILNSISPGNIDGLLVCVSSQSDQTGHFKAVLDKGIPIVFFDRVMADIRTSKVMQDDYNGAFMAVKHLIEQGYKKIAHITGPEDLLFTQKRKEGYLTALKQFNIPVKPDWIIHSGFNQKSGCEDTMELLKLKQKPDAVFAVNDSKAIGAMLALKKNGIRIGKEFGVIGFTNDPICEIITPTLSTVEEPALEIGKRSCELLLKHLSRKNFTGEELVLPTRLIERESTQRNDIN